MRPVIDIIKQIRPVFQKYMDDKAAAAIARATMEATLTKQI